RTDFKSVPLARQPGAQDQEQRADPLAAAIEDVRGDRVDQRHLGAQVPTDLILDGSKLQTVALPHIAHARDGAGFDVWWHGRILGKGRRVCQAESRGNLRPLPCDGSPRVLRSRPCCRFSTCGCTSWRQSSGSEACCSSPWSPCRSYARWTPRCSAPTCSGRWPSASSGWSGSASPS